MPTAALKHYLVLAAYAALTALLNLVFSKRSQIDEWCEANPKLAALAKFCRGFGVDPWAIAQSVVLLFTSKLPGYQKQTLVQLKAKPSGVPPLATLALLVLALAAIVCSCTTADIAAEQKAAAAADARLNQYCDARAKALDVLQTDGGGVPVSAEAGAAP